MNDSTAMEAIKMSVWHSVWFIAESSVWITVRDSVKTPVGYSVWDSVEDSVRDYFQNKTTSK